MNTARIGFLSAAAIVAASSVNAAEMNHCASDAQIETVRNFYKDAPASPPLVVQRSTGIAEELVVNALPAEWSHGISAEHFEEVTALFKDIPGTVQYVVEAAGTVTKVFAPITAANDTVLDDRWYDLITDGLLESNDGLMIHLFPEKLSSIYTVDLPGGPMADGTVREGKTRAIIFFGKDGTSAVGIYVTLVADGEPEAVAAFNKIRDLVSSLPAICS